MDEMPPPTSNPKDAADSGPSQQATSDISASTPGDVTEAGLSHESGSDSSPSNDALQPAPIGNSSSPGSRGGDEALTWGIQRSNRLPADDNADLWPEDNVNLWAASEEMRDPTPEPSSDLIQEIQYGEDINGDTYYRFLLPSGQQVLFSGAELTDDLKLLQRALAAKGVRLTAQDKRDIRKDLYQVKSKCRFIVVKRTGWYNGVYVTPTKVYGKPPIPILLGPAR
jgi:hypothetical protein